MFFKTRGRFLCHLDDREKSSRFKKNIVNHLLLEHTHVPNLNRS